eukprot:TRINITY_DN1079_c0_g1_i1.p1 TRINITY_DN1079_c0_g1~~TRINITY_DN1079_c0_g1_i1.p1  ORF type:complete len:231 (-),score=7.63 TRINITY_DN1079_c0_g1_i1:132-824(-)
MLTNMDGWSPPESFQRMFEPDQGKTTTLLTSLDSFRQDPDLVEDYFELLIRYFKRCPKLLLNQSDLGDCMDMALIGFRVQHWEASKAIHLFVQTLILQAVDGRNSRDKNHSMSSTAVSSDVVQLILSILEAKGRKLMTELVYAMSTVHYRHLDDFCYILEAWYQLNPQHLAKFMQGIISLLELDPVFPTKQEFVKSYFAHSSSASATRIKMVKEFSQACDRFQQTQTYKG